MANHNQLAQGARERFHGIQPEIALILGSGFSEVADLIQAPITISYDELEGFPRSTVPGHPGRLIVGTVNSVSVACMQGRHHAYEGHRSADLALPIRTLQALGCHTVLLTNAAGSLSKSLPPGSLMLIRDHINWSGVNPLVGSNDDSLGSRFVDMSEAYDPAIRQCFRDAGKTLDIPLHEGVYVMVQGPNFETPAEIQVFAHLGADAVGMSTIPECLVARHCGMRVAALSLISNYGAGIAGKTLTHTDTLAAGQQAMSSIQALLSCVLPTMSLGAQTDQSSNPGNE